MATLTIHNVPDDLLKKLERSARENKRTVEDEAVSWLSVTDSQGRTPARLTTGQSNQEPDPWLERANAIRESMPGVFITDDEELNRFKRKGRL